MMRFQLYSLAFVSLFLTFVGCESASETKVASSRDKSSRHVSDRAYAGEEAPKTAMDSVKMAEPPMDAKSEDRFAEGDEYALQIRERPQSGLLTAGSFDDNRNFDEYREFLSTMLQSDANQFFPDYSIGQRIMIRIVNKDGNPVGNARVQISQVDQASQSRGIAKGKTFFDRMTPSDGRLLLLTGMEDCRNAEELIVTVHPPDKSRPVVQQMLASETQWEIEIGAEAELPTQLDLALVIDTTGSMGDELEYLKTEIDSIASQVHEMFPNVDQRYSLIVYRDRGDKYVSRKFDFTDSLDKFREYLSAQSANGGGDYPEAMHVGMELAGELDWRDGNTARVLFLVGDAPPHQVDAGRTLEATRLLQKRSVRVYPLAGSGARTQAEFIMRAMSFMTMGQYLFLTDHSGVGNPHATPSVSEYQVERLDRLMVRMISSELAGKRLSPDEIIAIENGNDVRTQGVPINQQPEQSSFIPTSHSQSRTSFFPMLAIAYGIVTLCALAFALIVGARSFIRWRVSRILESPDLGMHLAKSNDMQQEYQV